MVDPVIETPGLRISDSACEPEEVIVGHLAKLRWRRWKLDVEIVLVVKASGLVVEPHTHGSHRKSGVFVARMVRVPLFPVDERLPAPALAWLDEHWRGEPFVPDELLPLIGVA